jgi:hypothetical protein
MNARNHNSAAKRLGDWWASPPRSGMQRLIHPYVYHHLRVFGAMNIAGGIVAAGISAFILSYNAYGWTAFFLVDAAVNLAVGYWFITIARSAPARA